VESLEGAAALVARFNDCINSGDLAGLGRLMSDDHVFIDTAGDAVTGKPACLDAWRGFFEAYPGYRNFFESVRAKDGLVTVTGRSECPGHPVLEGPALWTAVVEKDRVSGWRVYEDTMETRNRLGLSQQAR
jgi:ketosteroid isomerase-like protein